jgi:uncharacterized RDD family membrane protein YckC
VAGVVTGEAVVLDVPSARFPSRLLALALDLLIQLMLLMALGLVTSAAGGSLDAAGAAAAGLTIFVLVVVGYPVIWETASRGVTPGKLALGLRVTGDDGSPERFRQALVRGLFGFVEIWLLLGFLALLISLLSAEGKRLGDFVAGTKVIQGRLPRPSPTAGMLAGVPPALAGWAASLELSSLRDDTAETARQYLSRIRQLTPQARAELGIRLASAVAAQISPPPPAGIQPADYLAAVLAERGRRARYRLAASQPAAASGWGPPAPGWAPPPGWTVAAAPPAGIAAAAPPAGIAAAAPPAGIAAAAPPAGIAAAAPPAGIAAAAAPAGIAAAAAPAAVPPPGGWAPPPPGAVAAPLPPPSAVAAHLPPPGGSPSAPPAGAAAEGRPAPGPGGFSLPV